MNFEEYLKLTELPHKEDPIYQVKHKKYSRPWDEEKYTDKQRPVLEDAREAKNWKPGF